MKKAIIKVRQDVEYRETWSRAYLVVAGASTLIALLILVGAPMLIVA